MDETNTTASDLELQSAAAAAEAEAASRDLRTSLQFSIIQICAQQDRTHQTRTSSQAIKALTELTFQFATTSLSQDLDAFSSHANRKTVTLDDVRLVLRKSGDNLARLQEYCEQDLGQGPQQAGATESNNGNSRDGKSSRAASTISGTKRRAGISRGSRKLPPTNNPSRRADVDDSSSSSDDSLSLRKQPVDIAKSLKRTASKKIDPNISSDSDESVMLLPQKTAINNRTKALSHKEKRNGLPRKRIRGSSSSDDDDDDENDKSDVKRNNLKKGNKRNQNSTSQTRHLEKEETSNNLGHSSTQTMRIMAEMSPHSAASDDDDNDDDGGGGDDTEEDDFIDDDKENKTRHSRTPRNTLVETGVESSSSTEEDEAEFDC